MGELWSAPVEAGQAELPQQRAPRNTLMASAHASLSAAVVSRHIDRLQVTANKGGSSGPAATFLPHLTCLRRIPNSSLIPASHFLRPSTPP